MLQNRKFEDSSYRLLTIGNPKLTKGNIKGYISAGLGMAPSKISGTDMCPFASDGCRLACLNHAGRGAFDPQVHVARLRRTRLYLDDRKQFFKDLIMELEKFIDFASTHVSGPMHEWVNKRGQTVKKQTYLKQAGGSHYCIRLNITSDVRWEAIKIPGTRQTIFDIFPDVTFYDYTKIPRRFKRPANYHLTYSRSEDPKSEEYGIEYMQQGTNMTVVFDIDEKHSLPPRYESPLFSHPVLDGSISDLRFKDEPGHIVGLYLLGGKDLQRWARESGFAVKAPLRNPHRHQTINKAEQQRIGLFPDEV